MMDITKILELLETTPEAKLQTAKREFSPISVSATESANTILNKELGLDREEPPVARVSKPNIKRKAVEDITVTTPAVAFPETITFDEEAFAADYGIEVETLSATYVEASEDGEIPEHIEVSFDFEEAKIILSITSDGAVKETVNGEFIEPAQFIGRFEDRENEDGTVDNLLVLDLVEEVEDTNSGISSEEDSITKSEGDEDHINEDGAQVTDEFIEEAGLGEDEYFAKNHSLEVSKNPANRLDPIDGTSRASESLAARTARTYSK